MQAAASSPALLEHTDHVSRVSYADYEPVSKPTSATIGKRRASFRRGPFRPDLTVSAKTRHNKKYNYAPPASSRESWWRTTIKV